MLLQPREIYMYHKIIQILYLIKPMVDFICPKWEEVTFHMTWYIILDIDYTFIRKLTFKSHSWLQQITIFLILIFGGNKTLVQVNCLLAYTMNIIQHYLVIWRSNTIWKCLLQIFCSTLKINPILEKVTHFCVAHLLKSSNHRSWYNALIFSLNMLWNHLWWYSVSS